MISPVRHLIIKLILEGLDPKIANDLGRVLRGEIPWKKLPGLEPTKHDARFWEAKVDGWSISLADFSIADQPGHEPGDRGQSVGFSNHARHIVIASDGFLHHLVAAWLVEQLDLFGGGKTRMANLNN